MGTAVFRVGNIVRDVAILEQAREEAAFYLTQKRNTRETSALIERVRSDPRYGPTESDNLALACQGCNGYKSDKTLARDPVSREFVPLFHPRRHVWSEHFAWQHDGLEINGLTPTGRATVELLRRNRQPLINLRRALIAVNAHPRNLRAV